MNTIHLPRGRDGDILFFFYENEQRIKYRRYRLCLKEQLLTNLLMTFVGGIN